MKWVILASLFLLNAAVVCPAAQADAPSNGTPIEITCDGENRFFGGITTAEDNVVVRTVDDVIYCDRLTYNSKTKTAICKGNVRIYSGQSVYRGNTMLYNFETKAVQSADFRGEYYPAYVAGESATTPELNHYRFHNSFFTTDNREQPAYRLAARTIELYPNEVVVMKNILVYIGNVPVLWLPIYAQPLDEQRSAYQWTAGYSSQFGAYFYNRYNWAWDKHLRATLHFDLREKRGLAGGVDAEYKKGENKALFRSYFTKDAIYGYGNNLDDKDDKDAKYRYPNVNREDRYRISFKNNLQLAPDLSLVSDINKWSDPYVTLDFFESEYQQERQPDSLVSLVQHSPHYTLTLLTRTQINSFFETVERKPELQLAIQRQKIANLPISYEGESSITSFTRRYSTEDTPVTQPGYSAYRYDTLHQILYPKQYGNWLNITPRLGIRATYWSNDNIDLSDIEPRNDPSLPAQGVKSPAHRLLPIIGLETSFKLSRTLTDVEDKQLGIYGLRHVAEPFANAQLIPTVLGADPSAIRGFDDRLGSTRLAPINLPDYNSIDSIGRQAVVRHGVRNKIQTKRDGQNYDLLDWVLYSDLDIDRNFTHAASSYYSNIFSDILIQPLPWLSFNSQTSWGLVEESYNELNNDITFQVTRSYKFGLGNRYINNSDLFPNSNLITLSNFYRLNEHWQFSTFHSFEAEQGRFQEQSYTVYRDLSAWLMALSFKQRLLNDSRNELSIYLSMTLKAFPEIDLNTNPVK